MGMKWEGRRQSENLLTAKWVEHSQMGMVEIKRAFPSGEIESIYPETLNQACLAVEFAKRAFSPSDTPSLFEKDAPSDDIAPKNIMREVEQQCDTLTDRFRRFAAEEGLSITSVPGKHPFIEIMEAFTGKTVSYTGIQAERPAADMSLPLSP